MLRSSAYLGKRIPRDTTINNDNDEILALGKRVIPYSRGRHKEISVITPIRYLYTARYTTHIEIPVSINGKKTIIIIDLGATESFVSQRLVFFNKLLTRRKQE